MISAIENVSRTVLVVEDEAIIRMSAVSLVEDQGFDVLEASSADEAVGILEAHPEIRVVFTDIQMAGSMDGLLIAYAHRRWPPLQFIVVSGEKSPTLIEMPEGSRFFSKPYDVPLVSQTLHEMMPA